jgi:hypothetical protein
VPSQALCPGPTVVGRGIGAVAGAPARYVLRMSEAASQRDCGPLCSLYRFIALSLIRFSVPSDQIET